MIERDGANVSLWQATTPAYQGQPESTASYSASDSSSDYDVIIAGGGITGVTTALLLQKAGLQVALLEARTLCFGTTGGTTAHLNTFMDTPYYTIRKKFDNQGAKDVADAAKNALGLIRENIGLYNIDCEFQEADAWLFAQTKDQVEELEEIEKSTREVGLELDYKESMPLEIAATKILRIKGQAKFHPVKYVYALAKAFEEMGGVILTDCRVHAAITAKNDGSQKDGLPKDGLHIITDKGDFTANYLVYATHIPPGVGILDTRCAPYRSYAIAVTLTGDVYPEGLIYDMYDPYHYYRTQVIDGKKFLIAGGEDHKTAHEENTEACFLRLESHVRGHFDVEEIWHRWSSQYFEPVDGLPYIGHLPGHPCTVLVATGFGGNGMTYGTIAARVLTDLIIKEESPLLSLFDPGRLKPLAGFSQFVKENLDVLKSYIGTLGGKEKLAELAGLAPGEGKLVKFEGQNLALYKDDQNNLHALNPTCTHMKCDVVWNGTERSWDCPCHGARYDIDGKVLTGPADKDLTKIDL